MILGGGKLAKWAMKNITPYDMDAVQPASYDLKLSDYFLLGPRQKDRVVIDPVSDVPVEYRGLKVSKAAGFTTVDPGQFLLGSTVERVVIPREFAGRVEGKSSLARIGLIVHTTAGFIDPGFRGRITLEFFNAGPKPIVLTPGMFIAQLSVYPVESGGDYYEYDGKYQDADGTEGMKL